MNQSGLSFLASFDPSEFFEMAAAARETPAPATTAVAPESAVTDVCDTTSAISPSSEQQLQSMLPNDLLNVESSTLIDASNNIQIIGTHIYVPEASLSEMLGIHFNPANNNNNNNIDENTLIDFDTISNFLPNFDDSPPACDLPSTESYQGIYQFRLVIKSSSSEASYRKSTPWTFSQHLNKLYCLPAAVCPVGVSVCSSPPLGTIVRAEALYASVQHAHERVARCENHKMRREFETENNLSDEIVPHFVRCRHPKVQYDCAQARHSVIVPYERPQIGSSMSTFLYQFMCYSSCIGGGSKPVRIVLTLEYNNEVLGRDSFEVKICACPGRDRKTDEKKFQKQKCTVNHDAQQKTQQPHQQMLQVSTQMADRTTKMVKEAPENHKQQQQQHQQQQPKFTHEMQVKSLVRVDSSAVNNDEEEQILSLKIKGRKNYELLKRMNDALEFKKMFAKLKRKRTDELDMSAFDDMSDTESATTGGGGLPKKRPSFHFRHDSNATHPATSSTPTAVVLHPHNNKRPRAEQLSPLCEDEEKNKSSEATTLDHFLRSIDMMAYKKLITSNGILDLATLLNSSSEKIDSLKISNADTRKLWTQIQSYKRNANEAGAVGGDADGANGTTGARKRKIVDTQDTLRIDELAAATTAINNTITTTTNNNYFQISKYQIRYSFDMKK